MFHEIDETAPEFREYSPVGGYPYLYRVRTAGPQEQSLCAGCAREAYEENEDPVTVFLVAALEDETEHDCEGCGQIINQRD